VRAFSRSTDRSTSDRATARLLAFLEDGEPDAAHRSHVDRQPAGRHSAQTSTSDVRAAAGSVGGTRLARTAERWLPEGLRGARVDPGRRGAAALGGVVLLAALAVALMAWRARPQAEVVHPPPVLAVSSATSAGPAGSTRRTASAGGPAAGGAELVVAVTGKVRRPGVVTLPAGARVIDALRAAGGPLPGADLALLNLARKLGDGELVVVGIPGAVDAAAGSDGGSGGTGTGAAGSAAGQVDLNTATLEQLDGLPGVGPVLAQRILDWRAQHGRFASIDQLQEVPGIGDAKFGQLRDKVRV
jgi:competence protein ComEA